jgi:hypothetical protein
MNLIYKTNILKSTFNALYFKPTFNSRLDKYFHLLASIKSLEFIQFCNYNRPIDKLTNNIKSLMLIHNFNQPINNLPDSIERLFLGDDFNQKIHKLSNSLTHLMLGDKFDQPIDNIPSNVIFLKFGKNFNKNINVIYNNLPKLEILYLGYYFNQQIKKLPLSLKKLVLHDRYSHKIDHLLNDTLVIERFGIKKI